MFEDDQFTVVPCEPLAGNGLVRAVVILDKSEFPPLIESSTKAALSKAIAADLTV